MISLSDPAVEQIAKTIWGSPGGKKRLAKRLVALLPPHKTFVEPFAGSAAVLFEKEPAEVEAINDADPEIAAAYRAIKKLTADDIARLRRFQWAGDKATFERLRDGPDPKDDVEKLHRFLYLSHFAYGGMRGKSFDPSAHGIEAKTMGRIEAHAPRLKAVKIHSGDYEKVVKKYDGANTAFYLDPPYPGYDVDIGEGDFDEERFFKVLKSIKGKFLLTYGVRGKLPALLKEADFTIKRIRPPRHVRNMVGVAPTTKLTQLVVTNYDLAKRSLGGGWALDEVLDVVDVDPAVADPMEAVAQRIGAVATDIEKAKKVPFNQWGGSAKYAKKLAERLPAHKTFVEPFCGSAAVFFAKESADEEVLADADPDVVFAHRHIQRLDKQAFAALKRFPWKVSRAGFKRARECEPRSDAERFWKLVYGRLCAWGGKSNMSGFSTIHEGQTYKLDDLWRFQERLKGARLVTKDWKETLAECDGAGTLFFIDPPYVEEWDMENGIPPEDIAAEVAKLKGDYVIAYTDSARARRALSKVGRPFKMRFLEARHGGLWKVRSRLFVESRKGLLKELDGDDAAEWIDGECDGGDLAVKILKATAQDEQRIVFGEVLVPGEVDAQNDVISAEEIADAAHAWMAGAHHRGDMHRRIVDNQVEVYESFIAPQDMEIAGAKIAKGTWLLMYHVVDDAMWADIKAGKRTGFSIGGTGRRKPAALAPASKT